MSNENTPHDEQNRPAVGGPVQRMVRRHALLLLACLVFAGCTEPQRPTQKRGEARTALFKECMELAAKMPRQADDDVADIVKACASQSWYMTNHIQ
jgi:thiamine biosynthesis lipoprotein ApbE